MAAGALRGDERLGDDRQRPTAAARADAARADAEILVTAHGAALRTVRKTTVRTDVRPAPHSAGFPHTLRSNAQKP